MSDIEDKEIEDIKDEELNDNDNDNDNDNLDDDDDNLDDDDDDDDNNAGFEDSDFENDINEQDNDEKKEKNLEDNPIFSKNFMSSQNGLDNYSIEYLQKFNDEINNDYIVANHPECLNKNFDEIKKLLIVKRNKDNIIVDELHRTIPILTKYEKTKILGLRVKQLNNNSKPFIDLAEKILDNFIIANMELHQKKLPFIIQRPIPNGSFEYWKLQDLEIL
jgi:DNA-directed RNA polymerase subunit K/omega